MRQMLCRLERAVTTCLHFGAQSLRFTKQDVEGKGRSASWCHSLVVETNKHKAAWQRHPVLVPRPALRKHHLEEGGACPTIPTELCPSDAGWAMSSFRKDTSGECVDHTSGPWNAQRLSVCPANP